MAFDEHGSDGLAHEVMLVIEDLGDDGHGCAAAVLDPRFTGGRVPGGNIPDEVRRDALGDDPAAGGTAGDTDGGVGERGKGAAMHVAGEVRVLFGYDGHVEAGRAAAYLVNDDAAELDEMIRIEDIAYERQAGFGIQ